MCLLLKFGLRRRLRTIEAALLNVAYQNAAPHLFDVTPVHVGFNNAPSRRAYFSVASRNYTPTRY